MKFKRIVKDVGGQKRFLKAIRDVAVFNEPDMVKHVAREEER